MGIDLQHKHKKSTNRSEPKSENVYIQLLVKLYAFLARRTSSPFNKTIHKRLCMSKMNRPPLSVGKVVRFMQGRDAKDTIVVAVTTITDDERLFEIPALNVCALRFTEAARARIVAAGGRCLTFDQLALERPTGSQCLLVRGARNARKAVSHFGAAGVPNSSTAPKVTSKGRKFERARGRRNSRGYKA